MTRSTFPELTPFDFVLTNEHGNVLDPIKAERQSLTTHEFVTSDEEFDLTFLYSSPEWTLFIGSDVEVTPEVYDVERDESMRQADNAEELSSQAERLELSSYGAEAWRTVCSIDFLPALCRNDEIGAQWFRSYTPDGELRPGELTNEQYADFSESARRAIGDYEMLLAMGVIMLYHDIAKSAEFKRLVERAGISCAGKDHDAILGEVIMTPEVHEEILPTLVHIKQVSPRAYEKIVEVLSISVNYAQLLQGEAPASVIEQLDGLDSQTRELYFLHAKLDIAGVMGHKQHAGSTIINAETYQDTVDLEWALTTPEFDNPVSRYNAYLRRRGERLGLDFENIAPSDLPKTYALIRLAAMQRIHEPEAFNQVVADFEAQPEVVQAILTNHLNRNGVSDKAILHGYSPATLRALINNQKLANDYLSIYALLLHEAVLFDRRRGANDVTVTMSDLRDLATGINDKSYDIGSGIRFSAERSDNGETMLIPYALESALDTTEYLQSFAHGEHLRGKRVLMVGMAGGADNLHARTLGDLLASKYGAEIAGVLTVRKKERAFRGGRHFGISLTQISPDSVPHGTWRVTESALQEGENPPPVFTINATDYESIRTDIMVLCQEENIDVIVGVDPGGDSLCYKGDYTGLPPHLATVQDHTVIEVLAKVPISAHTAVIGPGIYTRHHARELMDAAEATNLLFESEEREQFLRSYHRLGMLSSHEANYSTTAMLFEKASRGQLELQSIDLPPYVVVSEVDPWRVFHHVTPAMGSVVMMEAAKQYTAIRNKPQR